MAQHETAGAEMSSAFKPSGEVRNLPETFAA
jgi:hypothetical protein